MGERKCPFCDASLDPGEKCECRQESYAPMPEIIDRTDELERLCS